MVRTYKAKRETQSYTKKDLEAAVKSVQEGMKVSVATKKFNVPRSTISDHVKDAGLKVGAGHPTVLTIKEEKELVATLQALQEIGFGLTKELVSLVICDYLRDQPLRFNPFKDGLPGKDWWQLFMKRWQSELSLRKPQHLSTHRASCSTSQVFDEWFKKVEKLLEVPGLKDLSADDLKHQMWNCDESGFCTSTASRKILAKRGDRCVHETVGGSGREFITILGAGCADGTRLPPYILYEGKNLWSRWMQGGPAGSMYSVSDSGWMESANFIQWFEKMFLAAVKHLTETAPVILFFDGHHSHLSIKLIELARNNNVHLVCFPPHTTHLIQPLDVGVFGPMKSAWKGILKEHQIETCATAVTKQEFPSLISKLWDRSFCPDHLVSGFRKTGIYPLSREAISSSKLMKALPFSGDSSSSDCSDLEQSSHTEQARSSDHTVTVKLHGTCTVDSSITPIRLELKGYFSNLLQKKQAHKAVDKQKVKPKFYGEAVTLDKVYDRLVDEEEAKKKEKEEKQREKEEKQKKREERKREAEERKMEARREKEELRIQKKKALKEKKNKVKKITTKCSGKVARRKSGACSKRQIHHSSICVHMDSVVDLDKATDMGSASDDADSCQICHVTYDNDDEHWMGCDSCSRWYHYYCLGFSSIPDGTWLCSHCSHCTPD